MFLFERIEPVGNFLFWSKASVTNRNFELFKILV